MKGRRILPFLAAALLFSASGCAWFRGIFESEPLERRSAGSDSGSGAKTGGPGLEGSFFGFTATEKREGLDRETESSLSADEKAVVDGAIKSSNQRDPEVEKLRRRNSEGRDGRRKEVFGF